MKAQVLRLGAPADRCGDVFLPGCIKPSTVPVTLEFDGKVVVGTAQVLEDGSAELELRAGVELQHQSSTIVGGVGIGFVVERWSEEPGGVRRIEELRPVCLGVSVKNKGLELQTCPSCHTERLITVRSIEDTFWCEACGKWQPCAPKKGEPGGYSSSS